MWIPISAILQLQADPQISLLLCFLSDPKAEYLCPTCRIVREKQSHMVKGFKLCGKDARDDYSTDVKTESQGSKQACLKSCGKWASGTPLNALDYNQVFWSYCFLRNQGPTEIPFFWFVFFSQRSHTSHVEDSGLSVSCWISFCLILKMEHFAELSLFACRIEEEAVRTCSQGKEPG